MYELNLKSMIYIKYKKDSERRWSVSNEPILLTIFYNIFILHL